MKCGCVACSADVWRKLRRFVHRAMVKWNQPRSSEQDADGLQSRGKVKTELDGVTGDEFQRKTDMTSTLCGGQ